MLHDMIVIHSHDSHSSLCCSPLPGDLENFRKNPFMLKEGVEYRIKINFKVRVWSSSNPPQRSV